MNFITKTLNKLFKSSNQQELNKIKPLIQKINNLEKVPGKDPKLRSFLINKY